MHQYFGVNQKILWDILQVDLPPLLAKIRLLLGRDPASPETM